MSEPGWFIWAIRSNFFVKAKEFLSSHPKIVDWAYPSVAKSYRDKNGKVKKKEVALYPGYICIKYTEDPTLYHEIKNHYAFSNFVGKSSESEMKRIFQLGTDALGNFFSEHVKIGTRIRIVEGLFKDYEADVIGTTPTGVNAGLVVNGKRVHLEIEDYDYQVLK